MTMTWHPIQKHKQIQIFINSLLENVQPIVILLLHWRTFPTNNSKSEASLASVVKKLRKNILRISEPLQIHAVQSQSIREILVEMR
jgi:hypothetical protein